MNNTGLFAFICLIVLVLALVFFKQSDTLKERESINNQPPITINQNPPVSQPPVIINQNPPVTQPPVIVNPPVNYDIEQRRLYSLGHEDGCRGRSRNPSFANSPHYESGYRDGRRYWHPELRFNINL